VKLLYVDSCIIRLTYHSTTDVGHSFLKVTQPQLQVILVAWE